MIKSMTMKAWKFCLAIFLCFSFSYVQSQDKSDGTYSLPEKCVQRPEVFLGFPDVD